MSGEASRETHNDEQIAYFANTHKRTMQPRATPYVERQIEQFLNHTRLPVGASVLDVGCGIGKYTIPLLRYGLDIEGLDLTQELLTQFRDHLDDGEEIQLHACDIVDFPDMCTKRYDAVVGFFAAHHFHDLELCFRAMARLVRPDGRVAFLEPNGWNPLYYLQIAATPGMTWTGDKGVVDMRPGPMFKAMGAAGFVNLRVQRFGFFPPMVSNRPFGSRLERRLERIGVLEPILPFQLFLGEAPPA